jgi:hypothetical protein
MTHFRSGWAIALSALALACGGGESSDARPGATPAVRAASPLPTQADLIVSGGRIYTVDDHRPMVEAIAIGGGRILFAGSMRGALTFRTPSTQMLDVAGGTVIPGMIDAHVHLLNLGSALRNVDLVGTKSYDDVIARVVARAQQADSGTWIIGRGWDQNDWADKRFPTHEALSRAVPDHPVVLTRIDGHAILVNDAALKVAEVTAQTADPDGGRIERGVGNAPAGVLVDNAMTLVRSKMPAISQEEIRAEVQAALAETAKWGLTGIHDAGVDLPVIDVYEQLAKEGKFNVRNYVMIEGDDSTMNHYFARGPQQGLYDNHIWLRAIKIHGDGALGSRGAALLEPYSDDPKNSGLLKVSGERIQEIAERALRVGFQVNVHEIGDRGNRVALDAFERALATVPTADHRFRIEHAQIIDSADIPRFAKLDVIPSMQTVHQTSDMYWAGTRIGPQRLHGAYAWRSLLKTGVIIPNGSDFPVEAVNPLLSFHAAFTRQDEKNWPAGGWFPEQRMTRDEAMKSMTIWPAFASFEEDLVGSLTAGKLADFVILDRDIMAVPADQVLGTHVLATYLGGRPIYERPAGAGSSPP